MYVCVYMYVLHGHDSAISCKNDKELGKIISEAYEKVGKNGVVLMEESDTEETHVDVVSGIKLELSLIHI